MSSRPSPWCRSAITFIGDLEHVLGRLALFLIAIAAISYHVCSTWSARFAPSPSQPVQTVAPPAAPGLPEATPTSHHQGSPADSSR